MPQPPKKTRPSRTSGIWSWIFILLFLGLIYWAFTTPVSSPQTLPISQVLTLIDEGKVERIEVTGNTLEVTLKSGETATSQKEPGSSFLEVLAQSGVDPAKVSAGIAVKDGFPWLDILLGSILPVALLVFFFFFFFRRAQGNAQDILSFGRSRAQLFVRGRQTRITFSDVAGVDEAKQELEEVVDFLKNAGKYRALGARIPKGVLLVGPAGTGKTLLARAVAGEANAPFYSMSGSEFMEMLVGVGAARVRDLFETAKKNSPSIIPLIPA